MLQLGERGPSVLGGQLRQLDRRMRPAMLIDHDPAGDRECPGAEVVGVPEPRVCAQRTEERLLERVVGAIAAEPPNEEAIDLVAVLLGEALEGR